MKPEMGKRQRQRGAVAPHEGAWIETEKLYVVPYDASVAPHEGAWIETLGTGEDLIQIGRPSRRGVD